MKRVVIGGLLSVVGSLWPLFLIVLAENNHISSWQTPPGRLLTSLAKMDLVLVFIISVVLVITGLCILVVEFFRKES